MEKLTFVENQGNEILELDDFYISFNSNPCSEFSMFRSDDHQSETAIVKDNKFYILNGDHRNKYIKILSNNGTFEDCMEYFNSLPEQHSSWSN